MTSPLEVFGLPGSPYTRKLLSLLRYRRIPHRVLWGSHRNPPAGYPPPKVRLLPTIYAATANGEKTALVDSTPISRWLESEFAARKAVPCDPELAFYHDLIEDYADEWLTKPMFHYRWSHEDDRRNAGPQLAFWGATTRSADEAANEAAAMTQHQFERLFVVGSNAVTADTIEASYMRLIDILDTLISRRGFVLGARPSVADFALFGQLTQLGVIEPTPAKILSARAPRLRAWIDELEDLSGLEPDEGDWFDLREAREALAPLVAEIGRVYAPFLRANAEAIEMGASEVETIIDGRPWKQPVFSYQAKCLAALRQSFASLTEPAASHVRDMLDRCACRL